MSELTNSDTKRVMNKKRSRPCNSGQESCTGFPPVENNEPLEELDQIKNGESLGDPEPVKRRIDDFTHFPESPKIGSVNDKEDDSDARAESGYDGPTTADDAGTRVLEDEAGVDLDRPSTSAASPVPLPSRNLYQAKRPAACYKKIERIIKKRVSKNDFFPQFKKFSIPRDIMFGNANGSQAAGKSRCEDSARKAGRKSESRAEKQGLKKACNVPQGQENETGLGGQANANNGAHAENAASVRVENGENVALECDNVPVVADPESDENENDRSTSHRQNSSGGRSSNPRRSTSSRAGGRRVRRPVSSPLYPKYLTSEEINYLVRFGVVLTGTIRISQRNFRRAYISSPDRGSDILVEGIFNRNRALDGDEVYYMYIRQDRFFNDIRRQAFVMGIKKRNHCKGGVGTLRLPHNNSRFAFFYPRDNRIPRMRILTSNLPAGVETAPETYQNKLLYGKIRKWTDIRFAEGEITLEIGDVGDIQAETEAIFLTLRLNVTHYSDNIKPVMTPMPYYIPPDDVSVRDDYRGDCVFTIDPPGSQELDDAISCKPLTNGNYLVGVHISDVSYFLSEGSALDNAVSKKAASVYLVQKAYHMLPRELIDMCSLVPGFDRLAFSVVWEITPGGEVVSCHVARSMINSCGRFTYDQVQDVIDGKPLANFPPISGGHDPTHVARMISSLNSITTQMRRNRYDDGALMLSHTKIGFNLSEDGLPESYYVRDDNDAYNMVEELMLLANITIAKKISSYYPSIAFLRQHSPPSQQSMNAIQRKMGNYGVDLDVSSTAALNSSLRRYRGTDIRSVARMMVMTDMLLRPMHRATYFCGVYFTKENQRHYALNVDSYTHFTSPIRRYADIIVHRLLAAALSYRRRPRWPPRVVQSIAENCNKQKYVAKMAGEKSTEFYLSLYITGRTPIVLDAVVSDIKDKYFDCIVIENGSRQRVFLQSYNAISTVMAEEEKQILSVLWPKTDQEEEKTQVIEMFSMVKLKFDKLPGDNKLRVTLCRYD